VNTSGASANGEPRPDYLPPWGAVPEGGQPFSVPPVNLVTDLYGDIADAELVVFFAGNQFMVVPDLVAAFKTACGDRRVFIETLPPGILARQIEQGALIMGSLRIAVPPDIYTAGSGAIAQRQKQHQWFADTADYARNPLAILVASGNPKHIQGLRDLGRTDVRVSMPNPDWEGIGKRIQESLRKAGGEALEQMVMETKVRDGHTFLTDMHHRQSPLRILYGESDVAPVWATEAYFQHCILKHPLETVAIADAHNQSATYTAGLMRDAPHPKAAREFFAFLQSPEAKTIYHNYHFEDP
jgi:ABC-type molybdate transport system substrate-binding protein